MYNNFKDYDQRQLGLMLQKINFYKNNKINLYDLLKDINFLFNLLHEQDIKWKDEFILLHNKIDYSYLNLNNKFLDTEIREKERKYIDKNIEELIKLINKKIICV